MKKIKRGEIYLACLDSGKGSEQMYVRPVLILQNNRGNKYSSTTIVACITSKIKNKAHLPTHFVLPKEVKLKEASMVMLEQVFSIDKTRLIKKICNVPSYTMNRIDKRILISLGIRGRRKGNIYDRKY